MKKASQEIAAKWEAWSAEDAQRRRMTCEDCSTELGELSLGYTRQELTKGEWSKLAYQTVVAHHPDWTMGEAWRYAKVRAPFYPFREPSPVPHVHR